MFSLMFELFQEANCITRRRILPLSTPRDEGSFPVFPFRVRGETKLPSFSSIRNVNDRSAPQERPTIVSAGSDFLRNSWASGGAMSGCRHNRRGVQHLLQTVSKEIAIWLRPRLRHRILDSTRRGALLMCLGTRTSTRIDERVHEYWFMARNCRITAVVLL